jgi:fibronectin-binding autotransporter adhesin
MMKNLTAITRFAVGSLSLLLTSGGVHAANVALNASDAAGTTSFNVAGHWNNSQAPSAANDYDTAGFFLRSPGDGVVNYTFAGASLTFGVQNTAGGFNGSFLEKFSGGAGSVRFLTINNLTNRDNAMIRSGGTAGALIHIQGNHYTLLGKSSFQADQCIWVIDSPLLGGDNVIVTNFANNANDHVSLTATNSGFTGSYYLTGAGTSAWSLQLENVNSLPGNPSTFNPGQITFLASGQLRDIIGCSLTNSNAGITLAANGTINTSVTTLIGEPITDVTNGVSSLSRLTSSGTGTLILSNANNNYAGGTTISAGTLQLGVDNAIPGATVAGNVTANSVLDLNGHNLTINGLTGTGTIETSSGSGAILTIGANGSGGTFSGIIQNSVGALTLVKVGAGTENLTGPSTYTGPTVIAGGTLSFISGNFTPSTAGNMIVSNGAVFAVNATGGTPMPVNSLVMGPNATLSATLNPDANGINVAGNLTLQDNVTNNFNYGTLSANPTAAAINVAGGLSAPGTNIVISISSLGLKAGTFPLIKYTGATLPDLANFQLVVSLGVVATLVNNTGNHSIDLNVTTVPDNVVWNGVGGTNWDLTTINWKVVGTENVVAFRQGDGVTFDDTVTNDFVNPQPTNVNLTAAFSAYPIPGLVVNSSLPYTFAGPGGLAGTASLIKSNSGSLTLLTSNSFTGGVSINDSGSLIIASDSALGASSGSVTLNGGTLQINGSLTNSRAIAMPVTSTIGVATNVTASLGGVISGAAASFNKVDDGTLRLTARETITGNLFIHQGTVLMDTGSAITNGAYHDVGQIGTDNATLTMTGNASFGTTSDFNLGDLDASVGTLNISGAATLVANQFYVGSANAGGSTASGTVNQSGGTITEISTAVGAFAIGGRASVSGVGVYNMNGGTLIANSGIRVGGAGIGTLNQNGGLINAIGGINIARLAGSFGTNNLNGGTLATFNVSSSTGSNAVFNFNGGTLQAAFNPPGATWFSGNIQANILAGGAIIDTTSTNNVTISTPLLAGSANGGLTKKGSATLTLTGTNTFTGPITNSAGVLFLNSASTYAGGAVVDAGTLQMTTANTITGPTIVTNGAVLAASQIGSGTLTLGNLTLNGAASGLGATIALTPTSANNPAIPMVNCGTLTLNGTNTISLAAVNVGTLAVLKYTGIAGSGNLTNLSLPQGATGFVTNDTPTSTIYVVVTSTGPGLVWTGTNAAALNTWNINATTNWTVNGIATSYHQIITPGDSVIFTDSGSGTVILNTNVSPASMTISNSSKAYTISGNGKISGSTGLKKLGAATAILSVSNNNYIGDTVISNGTLQVGSVGAISSASLVTIGSGGTLQVNGFSQTFNELTGAGILDNNSGLDLVLTVGSATGGTWNGTIQDHGAGALALTKNGSGTWVVGGTNRFANGVGFTVTNTFNGGTTILTNGGVISSPFLVTTIANLPGNTATVIVDGGTLAISNNLFAIGDATGASGALVVNNGTVFHGGPASAAFGSANNIIVGGGGSTGTLTVNGGQVLNSQALVLGQNATGSGTLNLNGGVVQATALIANNVPAVSVANLNGGTLLAATNSGDFLQVPSMVMSNGVVIDDGGFAVTLASIGLQDGDGLGGGLVKKGSGALYLNSANGYTGVTVVTNGLLAGLGSVAGRVAVGPAGTLGAGDSVNVGTFTANGNIALQGKALMRINRDFSINDSVAGNGNIAYGGTLVISNQSTVALTAGDTFNLFSITGSRSGNFSNIQGSPGAGLAYSFSPASGVLSVVTSTIATNPTNITFSVSGGALTMSWPADHLGWTLQSNSVNIAVSNMWFDFPPSTGSRDTNSVAIPLGGSTGNAFFRLKNP